MGDYNFDELFGDPLERSRQYRINDIASLLDEMIRKNELAKAGKSRVTASKVSKSSPWSRSLRIRLSSRLTSPMTM